MFVTHCDITAVSVCLSATYILGLIKYAWISNLSYIICFTLLCHSFNNFNSLNAAKVAFDLVNFFKSCLDSVCVNLVSQVVQSLLSLVFLVGLRTLS